MEVLDWVSLRRIGYSKFFDDHFAGTMEVPPDGPEGVSESDDEEDFPTHLGANDDENEVGVAETDEESDFDDEDNNDDDDEKSFNNFLTFETFKVFKRFRKAFIETSILRARS